MKRKLLLAGLTIFLLVLGVQPAHAGFWSWLEEFSGPGPFRGRKPPIFLTACRPKNPATPDTSSWLKRDLGGFAPGMRADGNVGWCFYYDDASLSVDADNVRGFPKIDVQTHDFGGSVPLADGLFDIGAGIGWISVDAEPTPGAARRFTVTPIRLVSRPLLFISKWRNNGRLERLVGSFKVYIKETAVLGASLDADDFAPTAGTPGATFATPPGEVLRSYGFTIDLTDLVFSW